MRADECMLMEEHLVSQKEGSEKGHSSEMRIEQMSNETVDDILIDVCSDSLEIDENELVNEEREVVTNSVDAMNLYDRNEGENRDNFEKEIASYVNEPGWGPRVNALVATATIRYDAELRGDFKRLQELQSEDREIQTIKERVADGQVTGDYVIFEDILFQLDRTRGS
ncbi:hypothetical protein KPH14_012741, partial [Odynerus spinipes]